MNKKIMLSTLLFGLMLTGCNNMTDSSSGNNSDSSTSIKDSSSSTIDQQKAINVTILDEKEGLVAYENNIEKIDFKKYLQNNVSVGQVYKVNVSLNNTRQDSSSINDFNMDIKDIELISSPSIQEGKKLVQFVNREKYDVSDITKEKITIDTVYFPVNTSLKTIIDEYNTKDSTKYTTTLNKLDTSLDGKTLTSDMSLYSYYLFNKTE